jgi:hypothetical protein
MKTTKFIVLLIVMVISALGTATNAQTMQKELVADFGNLYIPCVDRTINGTWTAHFTYFLDKAGKISRMHINTWKSDFYDIETGEEVRCFDVINDNWGYYFWFMNNPNAANGIPDCYNVKDGWLDQFMPDVYPFDEGTMVEMNWKFMIKGEAFGISTLIQIHRNAKGELTAEVEKTRTICRE